MFENPFKTKTHREKFDAAAEKVKQAGKSTGESISEADSDQSQEARLFANRAKAEKAASKIYGKGWEDAHELEHRRQELQDKVREAQEELAKFEHEELGMKKLENNL